MVHKSFTRIPHEILEALSLLTLSAYEFRVFCFILRRTFGWHRKQFILNISKGAGSIGLQRPHFKRALRGLAGRSMIHLEKDARGRTLVRVEAITSLWTLERKGQVKFNFTGVI